ncbi:MAG: hypothetical protein JKY37_10440, partial [Nannocystaceae bacterium]|nr:hypothetical protein [Nannocystaceae bacterium]
MAQSAHMDGHGGCARRGKQAAATAWASSASLTLALGCGPSLSDGDSGDSGADTGAPAVEDGESGPMLGEDCAAYLDTMEVGEPRTLVVRNSTSAPVYLAGAAGCSQQRFAIVGDDGTAPASLCDCEYVMTDESCGVCSSCLDTALRIEPGAEYSETWDGAVYVQGAIP